MSPGVVQSDLPEERVSGLLKLGIHEAAILHEPRRGNAQGGPLCRQDRRTNGLDEAEVAAYAPRVVFVDEANRVVELGSDPAHAPEGSGLLSGAA